MECYFIGDEADGRNMPFRYQPVIRIPVRGGVTSIGDGEVISEPSIKVEEYQVAAISVDKKQAIYTLSGTLDELIQPAKLLRGIKVTV